MNTQQTHLRRSEALTVLITSVRSVVRHCQVGRNLRETVSLPMGIRNNTLIIKSLDDTLSMGFCVLIIENMDCLLFQAAPALKVQTVPMTVTLESFELLAQSAQAPTVGTRHADNSMHMRIIKDDGEHTVGDEGLSANAGIEEFLTRPVKIATYTWGHGTDFSQVFDPWNLFLSNAAVQKKIDNYHLLKGNMMLTFYVNGTPFHVGMLMAAYRYLDQDNLLVTIGGDTQFVTMSQRPHLKLNVATSKSGCLCVPFFYPHNYLSLNNATLTSANIGQVRVGSFASLQQINGGADSVTITVYAQMQDVKLTGPTVANTALSGEGELYGLFDLYSQSKLNEKDEYEETGVISGPASTIAQYAGYLTEAPVIGPFALATQIGANALGGIARLFGYSRPVNLADVNPMRPFPISSLALTEGADTSQKLSLTAKQEISVDPRIVGLPGDIDEMDLKFLTKKESYLTQFPWDVADTVGTTIFACDVNPMCERRTAVTGGTQILPTSLSMISRCFSQWCGSLKFRFEFITSNFHRGRLAIVYDPVGNIGTTDIYNLTYNTIIDLADARDFTVEFKWQQDRVWLECSTGGSSTYQFWETLAPNIRTVDRPHANGVFYVQVVNELVVPDGVTGITGLVSISAGDDFMLQNPGIGIANVGPYVPLAQASEGSLHGLFDLRAQASAMEITPIEENSPVAESEEEVIEVTANVISRVLERPLVCYGEVPTHLRQILKRFGTARCFGVDSGALTGYQRVNINVKAMPLTVGWQTTGVDTAITAGPGTAPYNFMGSNLINYLKQSYAGWRGSIRWKFMPNNATTGSLYVSRQTGAQTLNAVDYRPAVGGTWAVAGTNIDNKARNGLSNLLTSHVGQAMTVCRTQSALEVEIPYQLPLKFSKCRRTWHTSGSNDIFNCFPGGPGFNLVMYSSAIEDEVISSYVAAGEDFCFHGFLGASVMYHNTTPAV